MGPGSSSPCLIIVETDVSVTMQKRGRGPLRAERVGGQFDQIVGDPSIAACMKMPALLFLAEGCGMKQNSKRSATTLQIICNETVVESPVTINYHHIHHTLNAMSF